MTSKKQKKKGYLIKIDSETARPYQIRDYFARKLCSNGFTVEKFNKIMGVKNGKAK